MDSNTWRAQAQAQVQIPGGEAAAAEAAQGIEGGDWRPQLQADSRIRIVNKIMDTLKRHIPASGSEGFHELKKLAVKFEEKIYAGATSQADYLRKISMKMLAMESKSQNPMGNSLHSNAASNSTNSPDPASQSMRSQLQNQVQPLPIAVVSNQQQVRQPLLSPNTPNNIESSEVPNSTGLTSSIGSGGQNSMPNVAGQNPNMQKIQNMSNVTPNTVGNSNVQGMLANNVFAHSQRQIPGRQQQVGTQEQQQSQNSQRYLYNQQLQPQLMKQNLQQGSIPQSLVQSQIQQQQQQNLLQSAQLQSSQQAVVQSPLRQSSATPTLQQSNQSMIQQQSQSLLGQQQQQPQHPSVMHQQQNSMTPHSILSAQQQPQHFSGQQPNTANMQHNQLTGKQNSILDAQHQQQQRLAQQSNISNLQQQQATNQPNNLPNMHQQHSTGQQNNLPNTHQQQLGQQNNITGFQQQQMVGIQHGNPGFQTNQKSAMLQNSKAAAQQQMQQSMTNLLPNQAQQSQSVVQPLQQQLMSQIQSQPGQLQQQANSLQRDIQQRAQTPGSLLQQHTTIDQHNQLLQSQRIMSDVPLTPLDTSSQTGNVNSGDWQEEVYQKIKSLNEMYTPELKDMYRRMAGKLQQHDSLPQQPKSEQLEKIRNYKGVLEKLIFFLRTNRNEIQPFHKENIVMVEMKIAGMLNSNRPRKPVSSLQQGQVSQSHMHPIQQSQHPQPQISHMNTHENPMSSQMQPMNVQPSVATTQQHNLANLQHNSLSSMSNIPQSRQNMIDAIHPVSSIDLGRSAMNSVQQVAIGSMQQNPVSVPPQTNMNSVSSHGGLGTLQSSANSLQASANILQPQHVKQEQQMFSSQQQYQQRQMQQQKYMNRQHLIQQQQQPSPQQSAQSPAQQMVQLIQRNDTNDIKMRQQVGGKTGVLQQHHSSGQRSSYQHQQMKSGNPFSTTSPQIHQAASPQINHHPSPQFDQQNLLSSHTKSGTPLQSANSPFIVPSPSTSVVPSPMPGDLEKMNPSVSSLPNAGNSGHYSITGASVPAQSLAIGTPGISASPLLAEFTSPDGTHGVASAVVSRNSNSVERPLERLVKVIKSMSPKALRASVSDISSVVSMVDRIAGSAPGNGSRAAVGEDLVAMTMCRLQARNCFTQDGPSGTMKMRRYMTAVPSNVLSSTGSVNDNIRHLNGCESDGESTGASSNKRPRFETKHALDEELGEINQQLIDTVVCISEDDVDPTAVAAATEGGEGTIVKCSFNAVALSPYLKSQYDSAQMSPIQPLRLLIPSNYPNCSPLLLDNFPVEVSKEYEDLSVKAKSRFSISLRGLRQPMSLGEMVKTWDICARTVISEYAQKRGGGSFSSKYGTWDNCMSAS